jgi:hypothetical protein
MSHNIPLFITANQNPERKNLFSRFFRRIASGAPFIGIVPLPIRPRGISIIMRVKDEVEWIKLSVQSIKGIADVIVIVDNGSTDGTHEILEEMGFVGAG